MNAGVQLRRRPNRRRPINCRFKKLTIVNGEALFRHGEKRF
jgi:hypothetical protein